MHDLLETNDCGLEIGKCRGAELEAHIIEDSLTRITMTI
jgi:hypothetical protein